MAEKLPFFKALLLSGCSCCADNVSREQQALAAFWLTPKARIHVIRTFRGATHRSAQVFFLDGITDANDHGSTPMESPYR
jgi:UDP-N-acetylmuramoylalanine-D-glutamate ligase